MPALPRTQQGERGTACAGMRIRGTGLLVVLATKEARDAERRATAAITIAVILIVIGAAGCATRKIGHPFEQRAACACRAATTADQTTTPTATKLGFDRAIIRSEPIRIGEEIILHRRRERRSRAAARARSVPVIIGFAEIKRVIIRNSLAIGIRLGAGQA